MVQKRGVGFLGLLIFWAVGAAVCVADFGTVDVLKPYSDLIVVDQGDEFWLTCSSDPAISSVAADIGAESYGVPIKPGARVPVKFEKPGEHPIVVYVDGYPDRTLKVQVMPKLFLPPAGNSQKTLSASASGIRIGMGSLYAGYYVNACDGTTGHKWPFRLVASQVCSMELRILSGGTGNAWSGPVVAGDNIIVVNNPSGDQWVLSPFVGGVQVGGTQTINTNTPYRLGITEIVLTTNTLSHTAGTPMAGLQTLALVNDTVTWRVEPNCWWTYTNACADLFRWSGTNLAPSGLTNGAAYDSAGLYQVKVYCHTDMTGKSADVAVLGLDTLKLEESADPGNTKEDSTQSDSTPSPNMFYLPEQFPGPTGMKINLSWIPGSTPTAGSWMKWKVVTIPDAGTPLNWSATSGDFSSQPVDLTWTTNAAPAERRYRIEAWFDRNLNGVYDTGEPHRMLRITVMKVEIKARNGVDPAPEHLGVNSTNRFKAVVTPAMGGTYAWTTPSAKMTLVLASSQTVRVDSGDDPSASMDAEELKVAFTPSLETVSCEDTHDLTLVKMDIDGDSNRDGSISDADEASEETAPGVLVGLNDDDDDGSGVADKDETGRLSASDDDLGWVELNGMPGDMDEGTVELKATKTGAGHIRAWFCSYKGTPLYIDTKAGQTTYTWSINGSGGDETISSLADLPSGMAIEGVQESSAWGNIKLTLTFKRADGTVLHRDRVAMTVVRVDLDTDSNNDGAIDSNDDNEDKYEGDGPGVIVCLDNKGIAANQEHYVRMKVNVYPVPSAGSLTLSSSNNRVKVWKTSSGTGPVNLSVGANVSLSPLPTSLWIDGGVVGADALTLEYKDAGGNVITKDVIALNVVETISFAPSGMFVYGWHPVRYVGGPGLSYSGTQAVLNNVKDHGWNITTAVYSDTTDDADPGTCTYANFVGLKYGGLVVVDGHGTATPSVCAHYLSTKAAADAWIVGAPVAGMTSVASGSYAPRYFIDTRNVWFANNWKSMRNFVKGITVFLTCYAAKNGQAGSPVGNAGGRIMVGYDSTVTASVQAPDMTKFFSRLNGSDGAGEKRTAGKAYDGGNGYNAGLKMFGQDWTTLGPSPCLAGKTGIHDGRGAGAIVFDTYMDTDVAANNAVVFVSGSGSDRRWFGVPGHSFGVSCDFSGTVPTLKAVADKCENEHINSGRKLSGDRQTYGQDKVW